MKTLKQLVPAALGATALFTLMSTAAFADCGIESGSVRILSNDFEALRIIAAAAEECASDTVTITKNQTTEHKNIQVPALSIDPAEYTVAVIANNSLVPLLNDGLVRPLDDLVAQYGQDLAPNQLIRVDGQIMAIAFMGNSLHTYYRQDILEEAGIEPPTSYDEMIEAAETLRSQGIMENPLGAANMAGWYLGNEFVDMYLGYGGEFFEPGSAEPAVNNEQGIAALDMMKALTEYMTSEYMTLNSNELKALYDGGQIAMMNQWGSMAGGILGGPDEEVTSNTVLAAAPTVGGNDIPAVALWWDGFAIAKNISDEDAAASFQAMLYGASPEVAAANPTAATWLAAGVEPGETAVGVMATANAGARAYPMAPYMELMHTALGAELAQFMQGEEGAEQALADVEAAYRSAAQEAGFL